jgi:glutamate formiminotransferase/formiminotetrahydrofolate cyclodeaminase
VPLRVMRTAAKAYDLLAEMAARGNPASISDVGVGLLAVRACIDGAGMNVRINVANLKDEKGKTSLSNKVQVFTEESEARFKEISKLVEKKLKG